MLPLSVYLRLFVSVLLPPAAAVLLRLADKKTAFGKLPYALRQIVFGLIFGLLAVVGTEYGVRVVGVTLNVRDAAPICAGLAFGAPAGVLSGLIGGVERWFAAAWGAGEYTKIACSAATIMAGLFSAFLRRFMFDDHRPAWYYGLATGVIIEVYHMLMVFLTHTDDMPGVYNIISRCAIPMIVLNGLSVMLALIALALVSREKLIVARENRRISQTFQNWLLISVAIAFVVTGLFTVLTQNGISEEATDSLLRLNLGDVRSAISEASDENLLAITRKIASALKTVGSADSDNLAGIMAVYDVSEINVINENGIITSSSNEDYIGFNMAVGPQSSAFMILLDGVTTEYVQEYRPIDYDSSVLRKYAGVALENGFVQVAYDTERFHRDIADEVRKAARHRRIGEGGSILICDESYKVVCGEAFENSPVRDTGLDLASLSVEPGEVFEDVVFGRPCFCMLDFTEGFYIIALYPSSEAQQTRNLSISFNVFTEVLIFTALFVIIYYLSKRLIVDNIRRVNSSLRSITEGNLDVTVDVRCNREFASLSSGINATVDTLRHYIDEAAARIDKELELAKNIQHSALPNVFPPFPNKAPYFDIWAGMKTAKEVGGDFYDFYLLGEDRLAFLIADVSGKGIPAAMFMMTAKTMLKNLTEAGSSVEEVFTRANEQLCENNEAGMFVTAWMGVLDLSTGLVTFANAGHNPPLVRHADGSFEYLRSRAGFVLAGMEGVRYRKNELRLAPGDTICLYTDGVTEATNTANDLYGEERLLNRLNSLTEADMESLCRSVKADVDAFVGEAPQFDDITMLALRFREPLNRGDAFGNGI